MKRIFLLACLFLMVASVTSAGEFPGKKYLVPIYQEERAAFEQAKPMQIFALPRKAGTNIQYSYKIKILPNSIEVGDDLMAATNMKIHFTAVFVDKEYAVLLLSTAPKDFLGKETTILPLYSQVAGQEF